MRALKETNRHGKATVDIEKLPSYSLPTGWPNIQEAGKNLGGWKGESFLLTDNSPSCLQTTDFCQLLDRKERAGLKINILYWTNILLNTPSWKRLPQLSWKSFLFIFWEGIKIKMTKPPSVLYSKSMFWSFSECSSIKKKRKKI